MSYEYDLVKQAIIEKKQIFATYQGYDREMCPHAIGTKNGRQQALFYQFGGESSRGRIIADSPQNWRCLRIDELDDVRLVNGEWKTGANHSRPQTCIDIIDVEVSY